MVLWDQMLLETARAGPVFQCFLLTRACTIRGKITQLGQGKSGTSVNLKISPTPRKIFSPFLAGRPRNRLGSAEMEKTWEETAASPMPIASPGFSGAAAASGLA